MSISLKPETQQRIEQRMKQTGIETPDDLVQLALDALDQVEGESIEELPAEVQAAIERAEAQSARGEGLPADQAFEKLRRKHFGA